MTREEYIRKYRFYAILTHIFYSVPASITLAQGVLESGNGNSPLAVEAKNHFGIKGEGFQIPIGGVPVSFRKYNTVFASYKDHAKLLSGAARYKNLFETDVIDDWANKLLQDGYDTNANYPTLLLSIIKSNNLEKFDFWGKHKLVTFVLLLVIIAVVYYIAFRIYSYVQKQKA